MTRGLAAFQIQRGGGDMATSKKGGKGGKKPKPAKKKGGKGSVNWT